MVVFALSFLVGVTLAFTIGSLIVNWMNSDPRCDDAEWEAHVSMTNEYGRKTAPGTFDDFLKMYDSVTDWEFDKDYPQSAFSKSARGNSKIHANMIVFSGVYMLFNKKEYEKFYKWRLESEKRHKEFFSKKEEFEVPWRK